MTWLWTLLPLVEVSKGGKMLWVLLRIKVVKSVDGRAVGQSSMLIKSLKWGIKEWTRWWEVITNML